MSDLRFIALLIFLVIFLILGGGLGVIFSFLGFLFN